MSSQPDSDILARHAHYLGSSDQAMKPTTRGVSGIVYVISSSAELPQIRPNEDRNVFQVLADYHERTSGSQRQ